jgi:hypothetical protein
MFMDDRVLVKMERPAPWPDPPERPLTGVMGPVTVEDSELAPHEINLTLGAIQRRLYSMCKLGVHGLEDVMNLPIEAFYPHCQYEAATLQRAGEKLCRLNLDL